MVFQPVIKWRDQGSWEDRESYRIKVEKIIDYRPSLYHHDDIAIPILILVLSVLQCREHCSLSFIFCSRVGLVVQL